jgi:hypothetical protein
MGPPLCHSKDLAENVTVLLYLFGLSDIELERFKSDVVRPGFERACKSDGLKTSGFDGKLPTRVASLCECFATNFAAKLTRDDMIAFEKSGQYPDEVQQRLGSELRRACQN